MKETFRKIIAIFTKIEKLGDILIQAVKDGIRSNAKVQKTLDNLLGYVETASDAVGTVLEWFGREGDVCTAEPRGLADEELAQVTNSIRGLLK